MTNIRSVLLPVLLLTCNLLAAPSGESNNPFNQFTDPSGGVSLFTGSSAYSHPLLTLSTRGKISLPISLAYSGNVELNARADNKIAPTSWVGLGWSLGFGKIVCNHHNTMTLNDDDYTWISPEGVAYPIYAKNSLRVKDRFYVTVDRITDGDYIRGWKITDESGNIYRYGLCYEDDNSTLAQYQTLNNSWYTLCWPEKGHVGTGYHGNPQHYPYQWNLVEMTDVDGNWIHFSYDTIAGNITYEDYTANEPMVWKPVDSTYTRECYIREITTNNGKTVLFDRVAKEEDEYFVPAGGRLSGREIEQPIYETQHLKEITVTDSYSTLPYMLKIKLDHSFMGSGKYKKSLLTRVIAENGISDNGLYGKTVTWFTYYTEQDDPKGLYGAIRSVKGNTGAETVWEYERKVFDGLQKEKRVMMTSDQNKIRTGSAGGDDFYVLTEDALNTFRIIKWQDKGWVDTTIVLPDERRLIRPGPGYVFARYSDNIKVMKVYNWDGEHWVEEDCFFDEPYILSEIKEIQTFNNHFVLTVRDSFINTRDLAMVFTRNKFGEWHGVTADVGAFFNEDTMIVGDKYLARYNNPSYGRMEYYTWDGTAYTDMKEVSCDCDVSAVFPGSNIFVQKTTHTDENDDAAWYAGFIYDGTQWFSRMISDENATPPEIGGAVEIHGIGSFVIVGNNFFILNNYNEDGNWNHHVYNWFGYIWKRTKSHSGKAFTAGPESYVVQAENNLTVWRWDSESSEWKTGEYGSDLFVGHTYKLGVGAQFQVAAFSSGDDKIYSKVNIWDGKGWRSELICDQFEDAVEDGEEPVICGSNSFVRKVEIDGDIQGYHLVFRKKFQNSFVNPPYSYVVKRRIVKNGVDEKDICTEFDYTNSMASYNTTAGTAMYEVVEVSQEGGGKLQNTFEIDNYRLRGILKESTTYKNNGLMQTSNVSEYETFPPLGDLSPTIHKNVYQKRLKKVTSNIKGNVTVKTLEYNNFNGQVERTTEKNSDGSFRITENEYAFEKYTEMRNRNMRVQPFGAKVYHKTDAAADPVLVAANVATWNAVLDENRDMRLKPCANYIWKVPMTKSGLPVSGTEYVFTDFEIGQTAQNNNWYRTGNSTTLIDSWGRPVESVDVNGVYSTVIYGNNRYRPVAQIRNAKFEECAVFTGNYDENYLYTENGKVYVYLDYLNGWEKCGAQLHLADDAMKGHFSDKVIYIDLPAAPELYGPTRNVKVDRTKNYILSAWVYVVEGTFVLGGDYRLITDLRVPYDEGVQEETFKEPFATATANGEWQLVKMTIPVGNDLAGRAETGWAVRIFAGAPNGVKAYIDDIRFYPEDAVLSTMYYDENWRQMLLTVDNNNHPGARTDYAGFGRPVRITKIDPSKSMGDDGYTSDILQTKHYNVAEGWLRVTAPVKGSVFSVDEVVDIVFENYTDNDVKLRCVSYDNDTTEIAVVTHNPENNNIYHYSWTVEKQLAEGYFKLLVQSVGDSTITFEVDALHIRNGRVIYPTSGVTLFTRTAESIRYYFNEPVTEPITITVNDVVVTPQGTQNTGEFVWNIPPEYLDAGGDEEIDNAVIKVTCNNVTVTSEPFTIKRWGFIRRAAFKLLNRIW